MNFRALVLKIANEIQMSVFVPNRLRLMILRSIGVKIGKSTVIYHHVNILGNNITIGDFVVINSYSNLLAPIGEIRIGDYVRVASHCIIHSDTHPINAGEIRRIPDAANNIGLKTVVKRGSWLGIRSMIMAGVVIEKSCVIAAGSVVNKNTLPDGLYAGVPAKRIRNLPNES